jgi:phosphoribosylanthranilate isomerase
MRTRVKVCCISSPAEAMAALIAGADAIGVVGALPGGAPPDDAGPSPLERARDIAQTLAPGVSAFLLTRLTDAEAIVEEAAQAAASVVQILRPVLPSAHAEIRLAAPHLRIVQVVHVQGDAALDLARGYAQSADAILLDSGHPADGELGGTGRTHDWKLSRQIVSMIDKPVFLAGGLHEGNVGEAIDKVRPYGVDLCSGVRTAGKLDVRKLSGFFDAVRRAG